MTKAVADGEKRRQRRLAVLHAAQAAFEMNKARELAAQHPAHLLDHVRCNDAKTGEQFEFQLLDPEDGWYWQRQVLDLILDNPKTIILKARQLGITWVAAGLALWHLLFVPMSRVLIYSITEDDAKLVVRRIWGMYQSLPDELKAHAKLVRPTRGIIPSEEIVFELPDGQLTSLLARPASKFSGHGEIATLIILDEFSRQEYAREIWKAVIPATNDGAKARVVAISTADGVSNPNTGEGNFFHNLWVNAVEMQLKKLFLRWDLHPGRDDDWYAREAMSLPEVDRAQQYPRDEFDAFMGTGAVFFDRAAMRWYQEHAVKYPLYRAKFVRKALRSYELLVADDGYIEVFEEPRDDIPYAIGADCATGRSYDRSSADVVDLTTGAVVASIHGKLDEDQYAEQLYALGRWYNTARIAPERGGGFGDAVIINLKDSRNGRRPYPKLYVHRKFTGRKAKQDDQYGFPMTSASRPQVLSYLEKLLRERSLPWLTPGHLLEMQTFVYAETNPSPRAMDGCNDDRVMSLAIGEELYRQFGQHAVTPTTTKKTRTKQSYGLYPWEEE